MQTNKISNATDKEIAEQLSLVYYMVGLRPQHFPTQQEDKFIFNYLRLNYGHKGVNELFVAFDLAIKGKLEIDDIKVYDQFSIEYLVRIMEGYRRYCVKLNSEVKKPEVIQIDNNRKITNNEKVEEISEWLKKDNINFKLIPTYLYDWLIELGYTKPSEVDKVEFYRRATEIRENELRYLAENEGEKEAYRQFLKDKKNRFADISDNEIVRIHNIYKRIVIFEYLNNNK